MSGNFANRLERFTVPPDELPSLGPRHDKRPCQSHAGDITFVLIPAWRPALSIGLLGDHVDRVHLGVGTTGRTRGSCRDSREGRNRSLCDRLSSRFQFLWDHSSFASQVAAFVLFNPEPSATGAAKGVFCESPVVSSPLSEVLEHCVAQPGPPRRWLGVNENMQAPRNRLGPRIRQWNRPRAHVIVLLMINPQA